MQVNLTLKKKNRVVKMIIQSKIWNSEKWFFFSFCFQDFQCTILMKMGNFPSRSRIQMMNQAAMVKFDITSNMQELRAALKSDRIKQRKTKKKPEQSSSYSWKSRRIIWAEWNSQKKKEKKIERLDGLNLYPRIAKRMGEASSVPLYRPNSSAANNLCTKQTKEHEIQRLHPLPPPKKKSQPPSITLRPRRRRRRE